MISFSSARGNLFPRLGRLGKTISEMRSYQDAQLENMTNTTTGVTSQYDDEPDIQAIMGNSYLGNLGSVESVGATAAQMAGATFNRMVFRDDPQLNQNLTQGNTLVSMGIVIQQMLLADATVRACTVTATPGTFASQGSYGNGAVVMSAKRPFDGRTLENAFTETVTFRCSEDSFTGGATEFNETFVVTGEGDQPDTYAFDWPLGSNGFQQVQAIDGQQSGNAGNLLSNSDFATWDSNVPTGWDLTVGAAGVNLQQESGITFVGSYSVKIVGDASGTLVSFEQEFNNGTGTSSQLTPQTQVAVNLWLRGNAVAPSQGVLTVDLVDENGEVLQDNAGVENTFNVDLTLLSTVFTPYGGSFRLPTVMPTQYFVRIRLTTALADGEAFYLDDVAMGSMTQLYSSGPYFAIFSGSVGFEEGDQCLAEVSNSRGAGGSLDTFQTLIARMLPDLVYANEVLFPSSDAPTIPDTLITS